MHYICKMMHFYTGIYQYSIVNLRLNEIGRSAKDVTERIHFKVKVNQRIQVGTEWMGKDEDCAVWGALRLPKGYSESGKKVPLVLYTHGAGGYFTETECYDAFEMNTDLLLEKGYAVFDINGSNQENGTSGAKNMGSPRTILAYKKAYDYITSRYHIDEKIFVHGTSMGGLSAYNFTRRNPSIVRAVCLVYPVTDLYGQAWLHPFASDGRQWIAKEYGFSDQSGNTWEKERVKGYSPMERHGDSDFDDSNRRFPVPIYMIHGTKDTVVDVKQPCL